MMDNATALSIIAQVMSSKDLKLCKADHIKLEAAYMHIETQLNSATQPNEASDEHLEANS